MTVDCIMLLQAAAKQDFKNHKINTVEEEDQTHESA